jgi:S1-C subfamily serine protease
MERRLCSALFLVAVLGAHSLNIVFAQGAGSRALQATDVFRIAGPSVVIIVAERADGKVVQGSGVAFAREPLLGAWVATNCHVVLQASTRAIRYADKWYPATLLAMDNELDLCLLISEGLPAAPARIRTDRALTIGEPVYAIGAPRGLELSLSNGIVSQYRQQPSTYPSNYRLIQTTAAISTGSSGGGLFDSTGRLVGITSFFIDESQNLNFAVPAAAIEDVLHASLVVFNMNELAKDPAKKFASTLDRDLPGWRQDLESRAFKRWLGLARDARGQRRTGGISSFIALPPDSWQPAVDLFVDYRSSAFYR